MKLLLDTHLLLSAAGWTKESAGGLPDTATDLIRNPDSDLYFSAARLWAIVIRNGLGRAHFRIDARLLRRGLLDNGYAHLPVTGEHVIAVGSLPDLRKNPFDRILIAQAIVEGIRPVTSDARVAAYSGPIWKV